MFYVSVIMAAGKAQLKLEKVKRYNSDGTVAEFELDCILDPTRAADLETFTMRLLGYPDANKPQVTYAGSILSLTPAVVYNLKEVKISMGQEIVIKIDTVLGKVASLRVVDADTGTYIESALDPDALRYELLTRVQTLKSAIDAYAGEISYSLGAFDT